MNYSLNITFQSFKRLYGPVCTKVIKCGQKSGHMKSCPHKGEGTMRYRIFPVTKIYNIYTDYIFKHLIG